MGKYHEEIIEYMHEFLDEEIESEKENILREHLQKCKDCESLFNELKKTIAFIQSTSNLQAPDNFTATIMARLPKEKNKARAGRWIQHHPFMAAASLFIILMVGSIISTWNQNKEFSVSKQDNLLVRNHTVIVPKGEVVKGDVVVQNGELDIEGKVQGSVTVINGKKYMASAGQVTGEIKEVNQIYDWIWYHMKKTAKEVFQLSDEDDTKE